ncbi:hypothetical protein BDP55DRAFT_191861 [Colletotrichum godetiae]|uniref:Uncharacterized protein n=1 Tax=Colletotrichum godetiae TaxID=1209918 RepID=A0AAJ0EWJ1_9PEZI|nr:uncharacterized protein BDP55DRAFT_191861 [Colletotrichum godetiae]KAK1674259.1 hypothetical protein BDP55DRAFT_191861 [Colletotrichum godetiae]
MRLNSEQYRSESSSVSLLGSNTNIAFVLLILFKNYAAPENMPFTTVERPVNNMVPTDQAAGSTRCAKENCNDWAVANSRYCSTRDDCYITASGLKWDFSLSKGRSELSPCQRHTMPTDLSHVCWGTFSARVV